MQDIQNTLVITVYNIIDTFKLEIILIEISCYSVPKSLFIIAIIKVQMISENSILITMYNHECYSYYIISSTVEIYCYRFQN